MALPLSGVLGIKQETAFGVEASPPDAFGSLIRESIMMQNNLIPGISREIMQRYALEGTVTTGGALTVDFQPEGVVPWLLKGVLGGASSAQAAPSVYDHSFTAGTSRSLSTFTLRVDDGTTAQLWLGCTIALAALSFTKNDTIEFNAEIKSQRPHAAGEAPVTPVYSGPAPWSGAHTSFTLNGETHTDFEELTLVFRNDVEPIFTHNQARWAGKHYLHSFIAGGNVVLRFCSDTERRRLWGALDANQPQRVIQTGTVSVTATHPEEAAPEFNYGFSATFPEIYYESSSEDIAHLADFVLQKIRFKPVSGVTRNRMADVAIRNTVPEYPDPE